MTHQDPEIWDTNLAFGCSVCVYGGRSLRGGLGPCTGHRFVVEGRKLKVQGKKPSILLTDL